MNAYLNYLLEASIGLGLFLAAYQLFLRKETNFRLNRIFLLVAVIASVTFPLIQFSSADSPVPSLNFSVEPVAEKLVYVDDFVVQQPAYTAWDIVAMFYAIGLLIFTVVFILRLFGMFRALKQASAYTLNNHRVVELKSKDSPFSFFNYIFIGNTPPLTEKEKQQIIEHESVHVRLYHSFDIVLLNIIGIVFWFNPLIRIYKKIFVQLHEFEADARAVETHDVDEYCTLLARVALHSADYKLANHFSNSLTLKRIEMMRTLKQKIKGWKVIAVAMIVPIVFFIVSCQDQAETPQRTVLDGQESLPKEVQTVINRIKSSNPEADYIVVPPSGPNLKDFEGNHARHISEIDGQYVFEAPTFHYIEVDKDKSNSSRYLILDYTSEKKNLLPTEEQWKEAAGPVFEERADQIDGEPVFMATEQLPEAPGGLDAFRSRLKSKVNYPADAKRNKLEGKVFIKFVVKKDGTLTNFEIIKGLNREMDMEALRLLKTEANGWKPATQNGKAVNARFVMPIQFEL